MSEVVAIAYALLLLATLNLYCRCSDRVLGKKPDTITITTGFTSEQHVRIRLSKRKGRTYIPRKINVGASELRSTFSYWMWITVSPGCWITRLAQTGHVTAQTRSRDHTPQEAEEADLMASKNGCSPGVKLMKLLPVVMAGSVE